MAATFVRCYAFGAAASTKAANPEAANALVKFLTGPSINSTLKSKGMESPATR